MSALSKILPKTKVVPLQIGVVVAATAFASYATYLIYLAWTLDSLDIIFRVVVAVVFYAIAVFIWALKRWAMRATKVVIALGIIIAIGGTFNPFYDMDHRALYGGDPPDWMLLLVKMLPFIAAGILCFWVLDKYKQEFR